MPSVLQSWVEELSFMQQSVLLTAVRGADGLNKYHPSKYVLRWFRRCIMFSAFDKVVLDSPYDKRGGNFTGPIDPYESLDDLAKDYFAHIDEIPHHFHLHVVHAAEILGYKHPHAAVRGWWHYFYSQAAKDMHLRVESENEMDYRLGDNLKQWQTVGGEVLDSGRA